MLRKTKQRKLILDILRESRNHPPAEEIYIKARMYMPKMSLSTVYRTLKDLVNEGKIWEIRIDGENFARYDYPLNKHHHFYCRVCRKLFDIEISIDDCFEIPHKIEEFKAMFIGVCENCLKGGVYENIREHGYNRY